MLPATTERVAAHTKDEINARIHRQIECNIAYYATAEPEAINQRLAELEREWDIERVLEANASVVGLSGMLLGAAVNRKWFILTAVVSSFLFQHTLQGWCPPVSVFRRLGVRTASEIDAERYALKALRGDFQQVAQGEGDGSAQARQLLQIVEK